MATQQVLCKGVDSSNNVLPLRTDSSGKLELSSTGGLPVTGTVSVSNFPATQAVSATSLPLPSGAATSALQTSGNASLTTLANCVDTGVNQVDVYIRNDDVGLATSAEQVTQSASLSTIAGDTTSLDAKLPSQGQAVMASSVPVVIASNQSALTVSSTQSAASSENSLSILAGATNTSVSKDTAGYSKVGVVITSDQTDTTVQLKWSHDDVTYYPVEEPSSTTSTSEIGGGASVNSLYFIVSPIAKYVRLDIKATTAASVKALVNLH